MFCSKQQKVASPSQSKTEPAVGLAISKLNSLPPEVHVNILDRVPYPDLLRNISQLSHQWDDLQNGVRNKKTCLVLYYRENKMPNRWEGPFFQFVHPDLRFNPETTVIFDYSLHHWDKVNNREMMLKTFPNISTIITIQYNFPAMNEIEIMFTLFRMYNNLVGFKWYVHTIREFPVQAWQQLIALVDDNVRTLCDFALYTGNPETTIKLDPTALAIAPQLRSLSISGFEINLSRLTQIRKLSISNMSVNELCQQLQLISPHVAAQLTELAVDPNASTLEQDYTRLIADLFPSLKCLYIQIQYRFYLPLAQVLTNLAAHTKLKYLRLWYCFGGTLSGTTYVDASDLDKLPQLASVEKLHLLPYFSRCDQLNWVSVACPNVKIVKIDRFKNACNCPGCVKLKTVDRGLFAPLKKCAHLEMIYYEPYQYSKRRNVQSLSNQIKYEQIKPCDL